MLQKKLLMLFLLVLLVPGIQAQRRMVAEWEPAYGTLIRWPLGIPGDLVTELAQDDSIYVLVEDYNQQLQAATAFQSFGVNMDHCRFVIADTYSHWTRDWGPHYVFDETGDAHIADPVFDGYPWVPGCNNTDYSAHSFNMRGYEEDDAVNATLAEWLDLPLISLPIYLTGGNIMTDGHGYAVSSHQMLDENYPECDEDCFMDNAGNSLGIHHYFIVDNPEIYGIQHIDCYAKFLDEEKILVKELPAWHPEYACVEELAQYLGNQTGCYGRKYEIVRIFCAPYSGNEVAAYTNSLILNKKVLVPTFGIPEDAAALQVYEEAMPGYEVIGFDGSWYYYDALHCRTMGLFDPMMLIIWHKQQKKVQSDFPFQLTARIDDRSETGLDPNTLRLYWKKEDDMLFNYTLLEPTIQTDSFYAELPGFPGGTVIQYYFSAADSSGRQERLPRTAPQGYYKLEVSSIIIGLDERSENDEMTIIPSPSGDCIRIIPGASYQGRTRVEVFDLSGRSVWVEEGNGSENSPAEFIWDTDSESSGIYLIRIVIQDKKSVTTKVFIK